MGIGPRDIPDYVQNQVYIAELYVAVSYLSIAEFYVFVRLETT